MVIVGNVYLRVSRGELEEEERANSFELDAYSSRCSSAYSVKEYTRQTAVKTLSRR